MAEATAKQGTGRRKRGSRLAGQTPNAALRGPGESSVGRRGLIHDKKIRDEVLGGLMAGLAYREACMAAGITETTFYNWIARAREHAAAGAEDSPYVAFFAELKAASAKGERRLATMWAQHAKEDYRAARDLLGMSPRFRDRWGKRDRLELSGPQGGPVPLSVELPAREVALELWDGEVEELSSSGGNGHGGG